MLHFLADMVACEAPTPQDEIEVAISKNPATGEFRIAQYKEYPRPFCAGLAHALTAQLRRFWIQRDFHISQQDADLDAWMWEAAAILSTIDANRSRLPDYQGQ